MREDALRERRENRIAENLESGEYIRYADLEKVLMIVIENLNGIPNRFRSSQGLTPEQEKALEKLIDETRSNMSALVKKENF